MKTPIVPMICRCAIAGQATRELSHRRALRQSPGGGASLSGAESSTAV
jgi:hypothetical protein